MLRVRDLTELGWTIDVVSFSAQLGPIVLMQHPSPTATTGLPRPANLPNTDPIPTPSPDALPPTPNFEDLIVATLPAPRPDGSLHLVIGRNADCDLVVDDPAISAHHATIWWNGTRGVIAELGSVNGTFINRQKIWTKAKLESGDQLGFGRSIFLYLHTYDFHAQLAAWKPKD